jgi:ribosome assembly protein 3
VTTPLRPAASSRRQCIFTPSVLPLVPALPSLIKIATTNSNETSRCRYSFVNQSIRHLGNFQKFVMASHPAAQNFQSYYLQRVTQEFSDDLDKIRTADDFKQNSVPFLVHCLQQGSALFSPRQQERILESQAAETQDTKSMTEVPSGGKAASS